MRTTHPHPTNAVEPPIAGTAEARRVSPNAGWWRVIGTVLGIMLLLVAYYWVHKPLDLSLVLRLGGLLLDLAVNIALFVAGGALGRALLASLNWAVVSRGERIAFEALAGLGVISTGALLAGMAGLFRGVFLWLIVAVAFLIAMRRGGGSWLVDARAFTRALRPIDRWARLWGIVACALLAMALARALAPPFAWDALNYHLVGPARYLSEGRIVPAPDNFYLGFPQLLELLFGVAMSAFGRDTVAAPLHFGFGVLGLILVAGLVRRHTDVRAGWLAVALPLSATSFWLLFGWPYVDLAVFAYGAAVLVAAVNWREHRETGWLVVAGVALGFGAGTKYTAGLLAIGLAAMIVVEARSRALRPLLLAGGVALVTFAPWMVRGALLYGNPVYPFLFGGPGWNAERAAAFSATWQSFLATGDYLALIFLPIAATIFGVEKGVYFSFTSGPWLLLAPLLLIPAWPWLPARSRHLAINCALIGLPLLIVWMVMAALTAIGAQTRLMAMALPVAVAAGALGLHGLEFLPRKPVYLGFVVRAVFAGTLLLAALDMTRLTWREGAFAYALNIIDRSSFEDNNLGTRALAMRALADLPPDSEVVFLWEPRAYGCPETVVCRGDLLLDTWARAYSSTGSSTRAVSALREQGADYLLVWETGLEFLLAEAQAQDANAAFDVSGPEGLVPIWSDGLGSYTLYAFDAGSLP